MTSFGHATFPPDHRLSIPADSSLQKGHPKARYAPPPRKEPIINPLYHFTDISTTPLSVFQKLTSTQLVLRQHSQLH